MANIYFDHYDGSKHDRLQKVVGFGFQHFVVIKCSDVSEESTASIFKVR
jgi:hypothetical protein